MNVARLKKVRKNVTVNITKKSLSTLCLLLSIKIHCIIRAHLALAGRPRLRFLPKGIFLASVGTCTNFNLISIPKTCLQDDCSKKMGHEQCESYTELVINHDNPHSVIIFLEFGKGCPFAIFTLKF